MNLESWDFRGLRWSPVFCSAPCPLPGVGCWRPGCRDGERLQDELTRGAWSRRGEWVFQWFSMGETNQKMSCLMGFSWVSNEFSWVFICLVMVFQSFVAGFFRPWIGCDSYLGLWIDFSPWSFGLIACHLFFGVFFGLILFEMLWLLARRFFVALYSIPHLALEKLGFQDTPDGFWLLPFWRIFQENDRLPVPGLGERAKDPSKPCQELTPKLLRLPARRKNVGWGRWVGRPRAVLKSLKYLKTFEQHLQLLKPLEATSCHTTHTQRFFPIFAGDFRVQKRGIWWRHSRRRRPHFCCFVLFPGPTSKNKRKQSKNCQ